MSIIKDIGDSHALIYTYLVIVAIDRETMNGIALAHFEPSVVIVHD